MILHLTENSLFKSIFECYCLQITSIKILQSQVLILIIVQTLFTIDLILVVLFVLRGLMELVL